MGKIPSRRAEQSTPVSLPGESHGQRSLPGPWDLKESNTTEATEQARTHFTEILPLQTHVHVGDLHWVWPQKATILTMINFVAFELWCWRRLLRVPWTARGSNQSILKEISPEYSLEGVMLKWKLQYFGYLMQRTDSFVQMRRPSLSEFRNLELDQVWMSLQTPDF